jgi:hypothetical protein
MGFRFALKMSLWLSIIAFSHDDLDAIAAACYAAAHTKPGSVPMASDPMRVSSERSIQREFYSINTE